MEHRTAARHHADHAGHAGHAGHVDHADPGHAGHADPGPTGHLDGHAAHGRHGPGPHERHDHGAPAGHADHADHAGHAGHGHDGHAEVFRRLFWWNLALAVPVIATSEMVQHWFGYRLEFPGAGLVAPVLGTVVYLVGGRPFLAGARDEVRARRPGMMLLIAVAITVAFGASLATSVGLADLDFWWELAALVVVMLLGHWLEMRAIGQASGALDALAALLPDEADLVDPAHGGTSPVRVDRLTVGDVVLVRPGARVPADGSVVDGTAELDESMITGESRPVRRTVGDRVVAGTVSTDSALRVRVDAVGDDTVMAGIRRLVDDAQASRSRAQVLADRAAAALFHLAMATALVAMFAWTIAGDPSAGVVAVVTALVIACPHALGLAIPLVVSISTTVAARAGILVKDRLALERMRTVDVVLFDKTGTLTEGRPQLLDHRAVPGRDADEVLTLAAAVERASEHPVARAIVAAAPQAATATVTDFTSLPGRGVTAVVDGRRIQVGGPALLAHAGLSIPDSLAEIVDGWSRRGNAVLHVVDDGEVVGVLTVADRVRSASRVAVDELHRRGVRVAMVTGDARHVADAVAADLGIDEVFAEVLPSDKDRVVADLQARGHRVAMVGDGVNDAPALARADAGLAIGAGTDVAVESAGVVLASDDPRGVAATIDLSAATWRKMVQNLVWATAYNLLTLPVAAGALAWAGVTVPPAAAAIAMSLSTIVVALNAQTLRRLDLRPSPQDEVSTVAG